MKFFQITVTTDSRLFVNRIDREAFDERNQNICDMDSQIFEERFGNDCHTNFVEIRPVATVLAMMCGREGESSVNIKARAEAYLRRHDYVGEINRIDEITCKTYRAMLQRASRHGFIDSDDCTMERYGISIARTERFMHRFAFEEFLIDVEKNNCKRVRKDAREMQSMPQLIEEVNRIYQTKRRVWSPGNPVHYVISADSGKDRDEAQRILFRALLAAKRIDGRRFTQIDYEEFCDNYNPKQLNESYRLQSGGLVVLDIREEVMQDSDYRSGRMSRANEFCRMAMDWKSKVLTVFLFPRDSEKMREEFFVELDGISLITLKEAPIFGEDAKGFLSNLAKRHKAPQDSSLVEKVESNTGYTKKDLRRIFTTWHDRYLRETIFPQYANDAILITKAEETAKGSGHERLNELIGLSETKALIADILAFAKAQELFAMDKERRKQSLHMIFSGNPGTAKTTVARLVAQILKENGVLSTGDLIEVGRADLVDRFLGGTAPRVKRAFIKAKGSVLFIDEAYSLAEERTGLYGDEAINTIVQEMENHRDEVVVIFAGYSDKMENFLAKNQGLRSRIGFHVNFPDYAPDELYEILELLAKDNRLKLSDGVRERVYPILTKATSIKEFGNGRYVRNLLEKAQMRQAKRLIRMSPDDVMEELYGTLVADDFEELKLGCEAGSMARIGFV